MVEPNFVIAGGQRCGTTTLYELLDQHPQIYLAKPVRPEPKFFVEEPRPGRDRQWYLESWFADVPRAVAVGEKSTSYFETPGAAKRMKSMFPEMRPIFILRHPVERAISNYRYTRAHGLEEESFDDAVRLEAERLAGTEYQDISAHPHAYLRRGRFADHLARYTAEFPRDQMLVLLNDELQTDPLSLCRKAFAFLAVDADFEPPKIEIRENLHQPDDLTVSPDTVAMLLDHFAEPNRRLAEMFDLDLSAWSEPTPMIRALASG